jgi:hypothetical protein
MPRAPRLRLAPFRFLVFAYWASIPGLTKIGPGKVKVESGLVCRRLQINYRELWKYILWLEEQQYLVIKKRVHGSAILHLKTPPPFEMEDS